MSLGQDRLFPIFARKGRSPRSSLAGYIDVAGKVVVEPRYEVAYPFREGLGSVKVDDLWGAVNSSGELVIRPSSQGPLVFTNGLSNFRERGKEIGRAHV